MGDWLIEVRDLKMYFPITSGTIFPHKVDEIRAVDGVSFSVRRGDTLGLVGESGSGKSTLGLCLLQLYRPTAGQVVYQGQDLCRARGSELRRMRREMQIIFQDPYGSLDPRMTAADIISEPLHIHRLLPRRDHRKRVEGLLSRVGLNPEQADRYPHEFSAGERQRVGIARALAVEPRFIVCDEPVSALDVCVQAQVLRLLGDLQAKLGLTYLFIAHDLAVVGQMSDRIAVMLRGRVVELGTTDQVLFKPAHPYTRSLISAIPIPDPAVEKKRARAVLPIEDAESPALAGCRFAAACPESDASCREKAPAMKLIEPEHWVECWRT
ncbi:MAG: ABC transporter ATP-binding protein [Chloroflexi bacterium]|nr:ABC transporter ATP-binding protein [Chloroflexota bacterium]